MADLDLKVAIDVTGAKALSNAGSDFDKLGGKIDAIGSKAKAGISAASAFGIGLVSGLVSAGVGAIIDGLGKSIDLASDKAEAASKAAILFGDSIGVINAAAANSVTTVGLSSGAYITAAGNLGNLTRGMGLSESASATMSVGMVQLAADMGSFNNADPSEVVAAFGSALAGQSEPLRKFGVQLTEANVKAEAMALGLYSGTGAMDGSARAQAVYQLALQQTTSAQGDFARTADGLANQQRIGAAKQEEAWTKLGAALLPIANYLMPLIADAVTAVVGVLGDVIAAVQKWMADNKPLIDTLTKIAGVILGVISTAFHVLMDLLGALFKLWQAEIDIIATVFRIFTDVGSKIFDGIVGAIKAVVGWFGSLWRSIQDVGGKVMSFLGGIFKPFSDGIQAAVRIVKDAWNAFAHFWNGIGIAIPEIRIPNPLGGDIVLGGGRFDLPHLPTLDRGGIVTGPTLAMLSANSRPEAVIPLDRLGGGGLTVNVYAGVGDPVAIGREVVLAIRAYERANGPAWAAA